MRQDWDSYFLNIALAVATRSTCPRKHVGAVLARDRRILATGYNGSLPGEDHCEDSGCPVVNDHCDRAIHAEINVIAQAARFGIAVDGATMYTTCTPCQRCRRAAQSAGVNTFIWSEDYP